MPIFVEPTLIETLKNLQQRQINNNPITTENTTINEDEKGEIERKIEQRIKERQAIITTRIEDDERTRGNTFGDLRGYHIAQKDYNAIINTFQAICPRCEEEINELEFSTNGTSYGRAYFNATDGIVEHETTDNEDNGDTTYTCPKCENEIQETNITYYTPKEQLDKIITMLKKDIEKGTTQTPQNQQAPQNQHQKHPTDFFPPGRQVQKDIQAHGPAGPQMHFAFRNNNYWACKHCSTANKGSSKKCENTECQKDKYEPIKKITL